jgi:hypothetical protein
MNSVDKRDESLAALSSAVLRAAFAAWCKQDEDKDKKKYVRVKNVKSAECEECQQASFLRAPTLLFAIVSSYVANARSLSTLRRDASSFFTCTCDNGCTMVLVSLKKGNYFCKTTKRKLKAITLFVTHLHNDALDRTVADLMSGNQIVANHSPVKR